MKKRIFGAPVIPAAESSDSEQELQPAYARRTKENLYQHLLVEDGGQSVSEEEVGSSDKESDSEVNVPPAPSVKKKNKKKKNKKKQLVDKVPTAHDEDVEDVVREVEKLLGSATPSATASSTPLATSSATPSLLRVERRLLNVVHEIKKVYQVDVLKQFDSPPERRRSEWSRRTTFVQAKNSWRPVRNTDLHMKLLRTDEHGLKYFSFVHGDTYRQTELLFLNTVFGDDRLGVERLMLQHPHHVNTLLLIAHVDGMLKRYAESKYNVEYALFTMEHVLHRDFDYEAGNIRLEYRHYENRSFHILLLKLCRYHHNLACHNTALELAKLLLSLDPSDPLGVTLLVDALALRADRNRWLVEAIEYWDSQTRALALPNMAFSYALAHYNIAQEEGSSAEPAERLLRQAIAAHPGCLLRLLERCGSTARDIPDLPLYRGRTEDDDGAVLHCLNRLAAERLYPVWKRPRALAWLEGAARAAGRAARDQPADRARRAVFRRAPPPLLRNLAVLNHSRIAPPEAGLETRPFPVTDPYPPADGESPYNERANPYWRNMGTSRHQPFNPLHFVQLA